MAMTGHGEMRATPDMAQVTAGVTTSAPTAASALAANTARMSVVFAAIKKLGVADKDIQTTNFSVSPQYTNGGNNEPSRLTGYQVNNEVSVRLEDVTRLGGALDALVSAGANQMNGISFDIRQPAPLLEKARIQAIADARARAQTYAKAAGVTLGAILSISEGGGEDEAPRPHVPAHGGHGNGSQGCSNGGRRTERDRRCHGGMGNPLTLYWSHDQSLL